MNQEPPLYPIALRLDGLVCLVVGGGRIAARKVASLLECGARVTVIAPEICAEIERLPVTLVRRKYLPGEAARYRLVITATGDCEVDKSVFEDGEAAGVMVNAADNIEACRFFLPALHRQGVVTVAVSTAGVSPYLATWLRRRISELVGPEFAEVASLLAAARRAIKDEGLSSENADWSSLVDEELFSEVAAGSEAAARARVDQWVAGQLSGHWKTPAASAHSEHPAPLVIERA